MQISQLFLFTLVFAFPHPSPTQDPSVSQGTSSELVKRAGLGEFFAGFVGNIGTKVAITRIPGSPASVGGVQKKREAAAATQVAQAKVSKAQATNSFHAQPNVK